MIADGKRSDRRLLAWMLGGAAVLIVGIAIFTPRTGDQDPRPMTSNTGSMGAKAALLTLQGLGRTTVRWDEPSLRMAQLNAAHTTLVLADPEIAPLDRKQVAARLQDFLGRGGRVLLTGSAWRAGLLPGGRAEAPGDLAPKLCRTTPEGPGTLAAAGSVEMEYQGSWAAAGPQFRVEQRCGGNAVVVRMPVGAGEAVWWSSATPLTNAGLRNDANLRLLLASVGEGREVYFDEYYFGQHAPPRPVSSDRVPLLAMLAQFGLLFGLAVWSFSRRKGPLRLPVTVPRSSPVEFARSMGGLYGKARATEPAVEAAQRRLERLLVQDAGLSREAVRGGPDAVAEGLKARFGGEWSGLRQQLAEARAAKSEPVSPGDALTLVRGMAAEEERLRAMLAAGAVRGTKDMETALR